MQYDSDTGLTGFIPEIVKNTINGKSEISNSTSELLHSFGNNGEEFINARQTVLANNGFDDWMSTFNIASETEIDFLKTWNGIGDVSQAYQAYMISNGKITSSFSNILSKAGTVVKSFTATLGNMAIMWLVGEAVGFVITTINKHIHALDNARAKYQESSQEVNVLNSQLEENRKKIEQINKLDTPTLVEQEQLEKLKEENRELEINLDLKKRQTKEDAAGAADEAKKKFHKTYNGAPTFTNEDIQQYADLSNYEDGTVSDPEFNMRLGEIDPIDKSLMIDAASIIQNQQIIDDLMKKPTSVWTDKDNQDFLDATNQIKDSTISLEEEYQRIISYKTDLENSGDTSSPDYDNMVKYLSLISPYINTTSEQLDDLFNQDNYGSQKEQLVELANEGKLTSETLSSSFSNVNEWLKANGVSLEDFIAYLKQAKEESESLPANKKQKPLTFIQTVEELDKLTPAFETLNSVHENFTKSNKRIGFKDITSLTDAFKDVKDANKYIKMLQQANGDAEQTQKAFDGLTNCLIEHSGILDKVTNKNKDLVISMLEEMGVANAEAVVNNALTDSVIKEAFAKVQLTGNTDQAVAIMKTELEQLGYNKTIIDQFASTFVNAQNAISNAVAIATTNRLSNYATEIKAIKSVADAQAVVANINSDIDRLKGLKTTPEQAKKINDPFGIGTTYYKSSINEKIDSRIGSLNKTLDSAKTIEGYYTELERLKLQIKTPEVPEYTGDSILPSTDDNKNEKEQTKEREEYDNIEKRLEKINDTISDIKNQISDRKSFESNLKIIQGLDSYIRDNISEFTTASKNYMKKANSIKLDEKYKRLVRNGDLDVLGSSGNTTKLLQWLDNQIGYTEYGNNGNKYAAIAGHANYQAWCDTFVKAALIEALGKDGAKKAVGSAVLNSASVSATKTAYDKRGQFYTSNPKVGDQVFFQGHTGIVTAVNGDKITTVEGNSGGGTKVAKHTFNYRTERGVQGFGRPDYGKVTGTDNSTTTTKDGKVKVKDKETGKVYTFDSDSEIYKNIQKYQELYEKAQSANKELNDILETQAELSQELFDMYGTYYDNQISRIEKNIEVKEAKDDHAAMDQYSNMADLALEKRVKLTNQLNQMVKDGIIEKYSNDWYKNKDAIDECTIALEEYIKALKDGTGYSLYQSLTDSMSEDDSYREELGYSTTGKHSQKKLKQNINRTKKDQKKNEKTIQSFDESKLNTRLKKRENVQTKLNAFNFTKDDYDAAVKRLDKKLKKGKISENEYSEETKAIKRKYIASYGHQLATLDKDLKNKKISKKEYNTRKNILDDKRSFWESSLSDIDKDIEDNYDNALELKVLKKQLKSLDKQYKNSKKRKKKYAEQSKDLKKKYKSGKLSEKEYNKQSDALNNKYLTGNISEKEYRKQKAAIKEQRRVLDTMRKGAKKSVRDNEQSIMLQRNERLQRKINHVDVRLEKRKYGTKGNNGINALLRKNEMAEATGSYAELSTFDSLAKKYQDDKDDAEEQLNYAKKQLAKAEATGKTSEVKLNEYRAAVDEAQAAYDEAEINRLNAINDKYAEQREMLTDVFDNLEAIAEKIESMNELKVAQGFDLSATDYQALIDNNNKEISNLQNQINNVWADAMGEGTKSLAEAQTEVAGFEAQINQLKTKNIELKNTMRDDVYWRDFERAHAAVQNLQTILESLTGFIDDDMVFIDGEITEFGITKLATLSKEYANAKDDVANYMNDLENLEKLYADGWYTEKDYKEKLQELKEGLLDSTQTVKSFSDSVVSMHESLLKNELDELKEASESYINALQKKKDYYDYDKTIRNQTKNIQALKAEKAALEGVATAEAKAKKARLDAQIKEAEDDLADTKYDHYITLVTDGLNDTVNNLEEKLEDYLEYLATDFDEIANIMLKAAELYESSADTIADSYNKLLISLGIDTEKHNWNSLTGIASDVKIPETELPISKQLINHAMLTSRIQAPAPPDFSSANHDSVVIYDNSVNVQGDLVRDTLPDLQTIIKKSNEYMQKNIIKTAGNNGWKRTYGPK